MALSGAFWRLSAGLLAAFPAAFLEKVLF